jgi:hypothetical protein
MSKDDAKRSRGRPPKDAEAMFDRINIRVPRPIMEKIDALHRSRGDGADKAQIIRELLVKALAA